MDLFNEYYNSDVQFLMDLFSLEQPFTKEKALALARANHVYAEYGDHMASLEKWIRCGLIQRVDPGAFQISKEKKLLRFAAPPNQLEREYLSDICGTEEAKLFLSPETASQFTRPGPNSLDYIWRQNAAGKKNAMEFVDREVFQWLLQAIYERRAVEETYCTRNDATIRQGKTIPYRLEYSVFDGRWWLISYQAEDKRAIKSVLGNIKTVRLAEKHTVDEAQIRDAILRNVAEEPVVLRIHNIKNGLERCFLAFESMLDMSAYQLSETEYELRFRYFRWDENIIVRRLLYLGECVTLISPAKLRADMIKALQNALKLFYHGRDLYTE